MIATEIAPIFLIKKVLFLQRSKSKLSQFDIAAVFIPLGASAGASTRTCNRASTSDELLLVLVIVIGKELELVLVLVLGKEIVLGKDYLVQSLCYLKRTNTSTSS